jgi:hypothetical protein
MSLPILTRVQWESYSPEEQVAYRTRLFLTRPTDKLTCKHCRALLQDGCAIVWEKPTKGKGKWSKVQSGDYCERTSDHAHVAVPTPWRIDGDETFLGTAEMAEYQKAILAYYRIVGFPIYEMGDEEKEDKFLSLLEFDYSNVYREVEANGKTAFHLTQTMHGLSLAWAYFPHMWEVVCNKMRTPMQVFEDDSLFMKAIQKRMTWGVYISDGGIRKALRSFTGTQAVSNFRPTAAAAIYGHFLPPEGGVVWDMSSGFGGRLLGAMACDRVRKYIGTDPSTPTMTGLEQMRDELLPMLYKHKANREELEVVLLKMGSEDYIPEPESIDLCFTSPPYFDCEKYSLEDTQSYIKYPSQDEWLHGFMKQTLANCHRGLKSSGRLVVNIAVVKSYPNLLKDFIVMAEENGWELETTSYLLLSKMMGTRKDDGESHKKEPIFVFKKA